MLRRSALLAVAIAVGCQAPGLDESEFYDVWIQGGTIVDGTGGEPFTQGVTTVHLGQDGRTPGFSVENKPTIEQWREATARPEEDEAVVTLARWMNAVDANGSWTNIATLVVGHEADVLVFDPDSVKATATWAEPRQHPEGFDYILVNGRVAVASGELAVDSLANFSRVLRKQRN